MLRYKADVFKLQCILLESHAFVQHLFFIKEGPLPSVGMCEPLSYRSSSSGGKPIDLRMGISPSGNLFPCKLPLWATPPAKFSIRQ